ncbi:acyltransferase domain-containing protein [Streptomyces sp. NPDC048483]|uniref:acyltransferase domain-containing protein n=1 Tax=Streptomyces sp. NPDC048483 TaxID=3154927 RepID=UPI003422B4D1
MTTRTLTMGAADAALPEQRLPLALLFPGQGAQHPGMAAGLYGAEPEFTAAADEVFGHLGDEGARIRTDWLSDTSTVGIDDPVRAQVMLFVVDYALGRMVLSWGRRPAALLGHSVGEMAAATLSGVFALPDAVALVRGRLTHLMDSPPGGMLAVAGSTGELLPFLRGGVAIGAVNAPRQTVLSGPSGALAEVRGDLTEASFVCRRVAAEVAFHSPGLADQAMACEPDFARVPLSPPSIPVFSTASGALLSPQDATRPSFWAAQPAAPVLFWPALNELLAQGPHLIVEAGPAGGLAALARQHPSVRSGQSEVLAVLPTRPRSRQDDLRAARAVALRVRSA